MEPLIPIVAERCELIVDAKHDVAAAAAVAAVGTTARDVGLATERDHALAAVTSLDRDARAIEEHLDPRQRSHERADTKMRELVAQALERARNAQIRLATTHRGNGAQRIRGKVSQQDGATFGEIARNFDERFHLTQAIEHAGEDWDEQARREPLLRGDAHRCADVGEAITLRPVEGLVSLRARRDETDRHGVQPSYRETT